MLLQGRIWRTVYSCGMHGHVRLGRHYHVKDGWMPFLPAECVYKHVLAAVRHHSREIEPRKTSSRAQLKSQTKENNAGLGSGEEELAYSQEEEEAIWGNVEYASANPKLVSDGRPGTGSGLRFGASVRQLREPFRLVTSAGHHVNPASRSRLDPMDAAIFEGDSLYARLGRAVCAASCLPRKEFFEAWEVGRRVQKRFRHFFKERDVTLVDLAAGHGFLAWVLLLSEPRIRTALCVDKHKPDSAARLEAALLATWPNLAGRLRYVEGDMRQLAPDASTLLVSVHACGRLTDVVLSMAVDASAPVAVVPCCHRVSRESQGGLQGWLPSPVAMDVQRAVRLQMAGYEVFTQLIPREISPENRLLMGMPPSTQSQSDEHSALGEANGESHIMKTVTYPPKMVLNTREQLVFKNGKHACGEGSVWPKRPLPMSPWAIYRTSPTEKCRLD